MSEFKSFNELEEEKRQDRIERHNARVNRAIRRDINKVKDRKRKLVIDRSFCGSVLTALSIASSVFGANISPSSVGYEFGHGAENASYTQSDPNDNSSKEYSVDVLDKQGNINTYEVPFSFLEEEIPSGNYVSEMINLGDEEKPAVVQATRIEKYPILKGVTVFGSLFSLVGAGGVAADTIKKMKELNDEENELKSHLSK